MTRQAIIISLNALLCIILSQSLGCEVCGSLNDGRKGGMLPRVFQCFGQICGHLMELQQRASLKNKDQLDATYYFIYVL